ncbi:MAG: ParB/RepB/Spo0J family partition protein [Desulfobacteraceae bacterium]|nr:MAG: ParB/RepB/Spo0J family partition protein [Desulfobacteraceae bacterium]
MKHENSKTDDGSISSARKKRVLGRGLDALFPDIGSMDTKARDFFQCDIDVIRPNPYQPRRKFAEEELAALSNSIKEQGILQPLLVRRNSNGYELIAGERRLRASKMAGLSQVPVVVREITDTELLEASIVENIQREDLNPMEEAEAYQRLMDEFKMTQQQVAERVSKSRSAVANFLRLCQLPRQIKDSLMENVLSMGHARALLGMENAVLQTKIWQTVIAKGLSVRQTEALVKKLKSRPREKSPKPNESYFQTVAEDLSRRFGTKVNIKKNGEKGKVEIEFYSNDDLDRLFGLLQA